MTSIRTEPGPAIAGVATVGLAAVAWIALLTQGWMAMRAVSVGSFAAGWVVTTAAMMLPSAAPFVVAFARRLETSRLWAIAFLLGAYLLVWTAFGVGLYAISSAIHLALPAGFAAGLAVAFAGLYALTPLKRTGRSRCLEMCREKTSPQGGATQAAVSAGFAYGLGCVLCSAGVMVALFVVGMTDPRVMALAAALVLLYKVETRWSRPLELAVALGLVVLGVGLSLHGQGSVPS